MAKSIKKPKEVKQEENNAPEVITPEPDKIVAQPTEPIIEAKSEEVKPEQPKEPIFDELKEEPLPEKPKEPEAASTEQTIEEKIVAFIDNETGNRVKLNDFLKSLYKVPTFSEPAQWLHQSESKYLRSVLDNMNKNGLIVLENERYLLLGKSYYPMPDQRQKHYTIAEIEIYCKK